MNDSSQRSIEAVLKFKADSQSAQNVRQTVEALRKDLEKSNMSLEKLGNLGDTAMKIGLGMHAAGTSLIGLMIAGSQSYIRSMGMVEVQSAKWLESSERISNAQIRIGRQLTEVLNPGFEFAASAVEKIATISEQNPWIVQAAGVGAAAVSGLGALTSIAGFGMKTYTTLSDMSQVGGVTGTLAKSTMAAGTVTLMASSVIIGAQLGSMLGNALSRSIYGPEYRDQNIGDALMTAVKGFQLIPQFAAYGLRESGIISPEQGAGLAEAINQLNAWLGNLVGASGTLSTESSGSGESEALIKSGVVEAYRSYTQQMTQAEEAYEVQRSNIVQQYAMQRVQLEQQYTIQVQRLTRNFQIQQMYAYQDFAISQSRALRDFGIAESRAELAYYSQRASMASSFHESVRRGEEDHQRQMARMREDHLDTMEDLNASRDALGMKKEIRRFEKERDRAEEDYNVQASRRSEDFARQLREMEAQFKQQRALRRQDFERRQQDQAEDFARQRAREQQNMMTQLTDMAEDHVRQKQLLDENQQRTLDQLKQGYDLQVRMMREAFIDRIRALDPIILGDYHEYQKYLQRLAEQFRGWLNAQGSLIPSSGGSGKTPTGYRLFGGYTRTPGLYAMSEDSRPEFVLNGDTVVAAERAIGGNLSQSEIVNRFSQSTQSSLQVIQTFEFHGSFSDREKQWFKEQIGQVAEATTIRILKRVTS